jgi:ACS family hexuronate transporter-like MFS transporter
MAFLRKWGVCLLLFLATTLNYLDRQTMGILAPTIQQEIHIDNEGLGWLFSVFYYAYTFAQFGVGLLLDRHNLRWAYGGGVLAWSFTCALTGLAPGFSAFIVFRLLLGVTESVNWPAALRIVSRACRPKTASSETGSSPVVRASAP